MKKYLYRQKSCPKCLSCNFIDAQEAIELSVDETLVNMDTFDTAHCLDCKHRWGERIISCDFNDNKFGKIFEDNQKISITNLITKVTTFEVIDFFNGIEYKLVDRNSNSNIGHSGYVKCTNGCLILINGEPILAVKIL